jgi:hypothetical protein
VPEVGGEGRAVDGDVDAVGGIVDGDGDAVSGWGCVKHGCESEENKQQVQVQIRRF